MKKWLLLLSVITMIVGIRGIFTYACTAGMATPELIHNNPNIIVVENVEATAYKCSCNPVNNHLGVLLRYQYYSNGNYYWDPSTEGTYWVSDGDNTSSVSIKKYHFRINYADAYFYGRCGSDPEICIFKSCN